MKIAIISKSFKVGGAGIAASRLLDALKEAEGITPRRFELLRFLMETALFALFARTRRVLFDFSLGLFGERVKPKADIVHLHWINGSFLSLRGIRRLLKNYKVVWTIHDMWPVTGGCHCPIDCDNYLTGCGDCQYLRKRHPGDLSHRLWERKRKIFKGKDLTVITPSRWMADRINRSPILSRAHYHRVHVIPNCVDTNIFVPQATKKRKAVIFGAYNIFYAVKGLGYFGEALHYTDLDTEVILFGKNTDKVFTPRKTLRYPLVTDRQLVTLYNMASVAVVPSTYDNFPSVVLEAMACGVPVVAFKTGGIPEIIDHKVNGYLAERFDSKDLAAGIAYAMKHHRELGGNARQKVVDNYTPEIVAQSHMEIYNNL